MKWQWLLVWLNSGLNISLFQCSFWFYCFIVVCVIVPFPFGLVSFCAFVEDS